MYFAEIRRERTLAKKEIDVLCKLYECQIFKDFGHIIVVDKFFPFSRLAFYKYACELLSESEMRRLDFGTFKITSPPKYKRRITKEINGKLVKTKTADSTIIVVEVTDKKGHKKPVVGLQKWENKGFGRGLKFKCKTALKPEISRFMINLANIKEDQSLLDPFCGSGGIVIEASIMGLNATGFDIDRKTVQGCLRNLHSLKLMAEVHEKSIFEIEPGLKFDCIVTEFPYGKGLKLRGRKAEEFYDFTLHRFSELLHTEAYAVIACPKQIKGTDCMDLLETIEVKKANTTIYIHVFKNLVNS